MRQYMEDGPYLNCMGLPPEYLREVLQYNPELGTLAWLGKMGRGGTKPGKHVKRSRITILGRNRNTFGIICLIQAGRLPSARIQFRDGVDTNWRWGNIRPDGWA